MELPKEIQELNDLLRPRWVSGLWNVDHAERPSDPKTRVKAHLWKSPAAASSGASFVWSIRAWPKAR